MTIYRQGAVVLLPFPFTDLTTAKQRPALIPSAEAFNVRQRDVVVLAITSQIPPAPNPEDYRLSSVDLRTAGLPKPSIVKCGKLLTIDQRLIRKALGQLPPSAVQEIKQRVSAILS